MNLNEQGLNVTDDPRAITVEDVAKAAGEDGAKLSTILRRLGFPRRYDRHRREAVAAYAEEHFEGAEGMRFFRRRHNQARARVKKILKKPGTFRVRYARGGSLIYVPLSGEEAEKARRESREEERLRRALDELEGEIRRRGVFVRLSGATLYFVFSRGLAKVKVQVRAKQVPDNDAILAFLDECESVKSSVADLATFGLPESEK